MCNRFTNHDFQRYILENNDLGTALLQIMLHLSIIQLIGRHN